ncbi:putative methyltransferase [compost metagenome]
MTKLTGLTPHIAEDNIAQIKQLFPDVFHEGKIDFDKLKQVLGEYVDDNKERYNFTWNGKGKALRLAQTPSAGTLRPCVEESKDWDTTKNLYIEGDNLEVLKLLQKSYHSKVKLIYIDPPYNTGGDFVYPDDFSDSIEHYKEITGQVDVEGKRLGTNTESSGRYHTDWLNMMYPRLRLARNLLADNGVIFISIDENEIDNLKKLCNEVFGEANFIGTVIWERAFAPKNDAKYLSNSHDYILIFSKDISCFEIGKLDRTAEANDRYKNPDNDPRGSWASDNLTVKTYSESYFYEITTPSGRVVTPTDGRCWFTSKTRMQELMDDGRIWFGEDGSNMPRLKRFLTEVQNGMVPISIWYNRDVGHNQEGRQELKKLFDDKGFFDGPKPVRLLNRIMKIANLGTEDIVLDFFSGSATTAHSVMQQNCLEDHNNRFIMVQLPEPTDEKGEAYKAGYTNICEIGKERIRSAGEKIVTEEGLKAQHLDIGFKVFKLDSSNLRQWQPDYDDLEYSLFESISNYVDGRTELDVVYEIMIKMGLDLSEPVEECMISGKKVYSVGFGALMMCLDDDITTNVAHGMVQLKGELAPETWKVVFKDNGFHSDSNKTNIKEILKCAGLVEDAFTTL